MWRWKKSPRSGQPISTALPRAFSRRNKRAAGVLLIVVLLVGCRQPGGERPEIEQVRPPLREFSVLLEGMPETLSARLWQAPTSFPLQFSTYVPADMTVSVSEVGATLELIAAFGGVR